MLCSWDAELRNIRMMGYQVVKNFLQCIKPFWHNNSVWWTDIHPGGWIWYSIIALCIGMLCLCITTPSTIIIIILMLLLLCSRCPLLVDLVITCEVDRIHRQVMSAPKCSVSLVSALETEWRRFVWWTTRLHSLWICSHPMKINQWPTVSVT